MNSPIEFELASQKSSSNSIVSTLKSSYDLESAVKASKDADLIYHINRIIDIQRLYILLSLIKEILQLAYENGHPNF